MWANFDTEPSPSSMEGPAPSLPFGPNISNFCPECLPGCLPWCFWFPPPPPPVEMMSSHESDPTFSPLVIAIIGILVSAFLLVSYYTLVARYCTNWEALRRRLRRGGGGHGGRFEDEEDSMNVASGDSWPVFRDGLEESLIKSIPAYKYSRNNAELLQDYCSDCTVCLSEFREEETVRVLPKCSHVFHMSCIDKWLQTHSSCPLCRASIVSPPAAAPEAATRVTVPDEDFRSANRSFRDHISSSHYNNNSSNNGDLQGYREQGCSNNHGCSQQQQQDFRAMSDLAIRHRADDRVAELRGEFQPMRRSVSLSAASSMFVSMEIIQNGGVRFGFEDKSCSEVSSQRKRNGHGSKRFDKGKISAAAAGGEGSRSGILHHVMGPLAMKRSFSGTRMLLSRSRNSILPL